MKRIRLILLSLGLLIALVITYSNHFDNGFHFDDSHSVVNNVYIRDLKNIPLFFKDGKTLTSLPANQGYRPMMPTLYAVDYALGDGLNSTFMFHLTTFIWYVLQCVLMYFILLHIFNRARPHPWNPFISIAAVAWYAFHTANAETINYISARSDSISTFWLIVSFAVYIFYPRLRKFGVYLIPLIIGILVKPAVLVFPGLLFFYVAFFHEPVYFKGIKNGFLRKVFNAFLVALPSLIVCAGLYILQAKMTPGTFEPGGSRFHYLITQPFVSLHYFKTFFLPTELSADTDWRPLETWQDWRFFTGMFFILIMMAIALLTWYKKRTAPIAFGILWFFIALLPSSSIIPFAEVLNDHRTFFPYIGLLISVVWSLSLLVKEKDSAAQLAMRRMGLTGLAVVVISINAYGTYKRNEVWHDNESLWKDVTIKSPKNGRGWMNYGLALMAKGQYAEAEECFKRSEKIWPYYSYLHVNFGILKAAKGDKAAAEKYFKNALAYGADNPEPYYYYAEFLHRNNRSAEALGLLEKCIQLSPAHSMARYLIMTIYAQQGEWKKLQETASATLAIMPGDATAQHYLDMSRNAKPKLQVAEEAVKANPTAENYLNLSLEYCNVFRFREAIDACQQALKLKPDYAIAYNNLCYAYSQLGKFDEAVAACDKALKLDPSYELAKNNRTIALQRKQGIAELEKKAKNNPTADNYIELSLVYYNQGMYEKCIEACREALKLKPDYATAYNNICSAYNQMKMWDKAIEACSEAIRLQPDFELAKNNLIFARSQLK